MNQNTFYISGPASAFINYFKGLHQCYEVNMKCMNELMCKSAFYDLYITEEIPIDREEFVYEFSLSNEIAENLEDKNYDEMIKILITRYNEETK